MSENNLTIGEQRSLPPSNGSEIAKVGNKKGVSRRAFLKFTGATLASLILSRSLPDQPQVSTVDVSNNQQPLPTQVPNPTPIETPTQQPEGLLQPETIHGVEVFGLKEKIDTDEQIDKLYQHFDEVFNMEVPESLKDASRQDQRDAVLPKDKRYAEFVVTQSAFDGWERENGVDYVSWVKLHIDLLNRACQNAKPSAPISTEVLRVVVIQDNFKNNPSRYSKDMDGTWFNNLPKVTSSYYWNYSVAPDGSVIFYPLYGGVNSEWAIRYPPSDDSFKDTQQGRVDCGTTHELSHQILNLPDEYNYDYDLGNEHNKRFQRFYFDTGSFTSPQMSPNLAWILRYHIDKGIRGYYTDQVGLGTYSAYKETNLKKPVSYSLKPSLCRFELVTKNEATEKIEVFKIRQEGDYASKKYFLESPDQIEAQNSFTLDPQLLEPRKLDNDNFVFYPLNWVIRTGKKELCLPEAAFVMSKAAENDQANYKIEFSGYDDLSKKTQIVKLVDESDLADFLDKCSQRNEQYYAKMKVSGTSAWFIWFLRD